MAEESTDSGAPAKNTFSDKASEDQPTAPSASEAPNNAKADATVTEGSPVHENGANGAAPEETSTSNINGNAAVTTAGLASPPAETADLHVQTNDDSPSTNKNDPTPETPNARANKKGSNGSSKKRSSGVPEHRSRKQGKKKSKPVAQIDAKPGELFLARMKGHQPWPSIICDEDMLPTVILNSRPTTAAQADGSFKKPDYAPGGKRAQDRTFPLMFLRTNEFAWIPATGLTPITPEECGAAAEKQKSKTLSEAYKVAEEGNDLAHFKQVLLEHQEMLNADEEAKAEREAQKAEKNAKQKRKSDAVLASAEDKMEVDDEPSAKTQAKKRKKDVAVDDGEKPAKAAKTGPTKLKLNMTPKSAANDSKKKTPKNKSSTKKSTAKGGPSDEEETSKAPEEPLTEEEIREKKEKEVRYIRHKLQKGFLSRDDPPTENEIETMSNYLTKVETSSDLDGGIIRATKIHKVLKAMLRLDSIPMDDKHNFKKRSRELLEKWNKSFFSDAAGTAEKGDDAKTDEPHQPSAGDEAATESAIPTKDDGNVWPGRDTPKESAETAKAETSDVAPKASATDPTDHPSEENTGMKQETKGDEEHAEAPKDATDSNAIQA